MAEARRERLPLSDAQAQAVFFARQAELHKQSAVISAAKSGAALNIVKDQLAHGEFTPWIEANMPVNARQCRKFMQLADARPDLVDSKRHPDAVLDIDSEIKLLSVDDEAEESVRKIAKEEDLTRKEIADLTKKLTASEEKTKDVS